MILKIKFSSFFFELRNKSKIDISMIDSAFSKKFRNLSHIISITIRNYSQQIHSNFTPEMVSSILE